MKSSAILTRAAELVDSGNCHDAVVAIRWDNYELARSALFLWAKHIGPSYFGDDRKHRVLALLLCAAIAESEGD